MRTGSQLSRRARLPPPPWVTEACVEDSTCVLVSCVPVGAVAVGMGVAAAAAASSSSSPPLPAAADNAAEADRRREAPGLLRRATIAPGLSVCLSVWVHGERPGRGGGG